MPLSLKTSKSMDSSFFSVCTWCVGSNSLAPTTNSIYFVCYHHSLDKQMESTHVPQSSEDGLSDEALMTDLQVTYQPETNAH